jgi:DNA-directed RNA polymerase specialized sigma24 family protein
MLDSDDHRGATLEKLIPCCQEQIIQITGRQTESTELRCCFEILRRASEQNAIAFHSLMYIARPVVHRHCQRFGVDNATIEDLQMQVSARLEHKFLNSDSRYVAQSFLKFEGYLHTTVHNVYLNLVRRRSHVPLDESLEQERSLTDNSSFNEPARAAELNDERSWLISGLDSISDPLVRQAVKLRYLDDLDCDAIVAILRQQESSMTKLRVYRLVENGVRKLRRIAGIDKRSRAE